MKQSTKRLISFGGAIILLFATLIIFSSFIRPAYTEAQSVKAERLSRERVLADQRAAVAQVQALIEAYRETGDIAEVVALALPEDEHQAEAINNVNQLAGTHGLAVQSIAIAPSPSESITRGQDGGQEILVKPVGSFTMQVRLAGTYASIRAFLGNIETNIRIMNIRTMNISPVGNANQDFYNFDITFSAYYQNS